MREGGRCAPFLLTGWLYIKTVFCYAYDTLKAEKDTVNAPQTYDGKTLQLVPPPRINLGTIKAVRLEASRVYKDMRSGRMDKADGCKLVYALLRSPR